jgi:hypothetical protein
MKTKFLVASLFAILAWLALYLRWQKHHYRDTMKAFHNLVDAMEREDRVRLANLTSPYKLDWLEQVAEPYGGIQPLGHLLRKSADVSQAIHVPINSVGIAVQVEDQQLWVYFALEKSGWKLDHVQVSGQHNE